MQNQSRKTMFLLLHVAQVQILHWCQLFVEYIDYNYA